MRSTAYLPGFSLFSPVAGTVCDGEDAEIEVGSTLLDARDGGTSEADTGKAQKRNEVAQIASKCFTRYPPWTVRGS
jgi:hypothetical protein